MSSRLETLGAGDATPSMLSSSAGSAPASRRCRQASRTAPRSRSAPLATASCLLLSSTFGTAAAAASPSPLTLTGPSSLPPIDYSRMGTVAFLGSFSGLDFYDSSSSSSSFSSSATYSSAADSLIRRPADGSSSRVLANTDDGGTIASTCWSSSGSGTNGTLYVGGSFEALGGQANTRNIAAYDLASGTVAAVGTGLDGAVRAVYCDDDNGRIWVGGEFAGAVAVWHTGNGSWSAPPFSALNGPVDSISPLSSSLLFGGRFSTAFGTINSTLVNETSASAAPDGTTTVGFSGYLTPVSIPTGAGSNVSVSAIPATETSGFTDPNVLFCPSGPDAAGTSWFAQNNSAAKITVNLFRSTQASGLRIGNTFQQGKGTVNFRAISIPDNTQLELAYVDPATGDNVTCSDACTLSTDTSVLAQDFAFTSGARDLTGFQIYLDSWKGTGAGLHRLQLLSSGAETSAVEPQGAGSCGGSAAQTAQTAGDWQQVTTPTTIPGTINNVLEASVSTTSSDRPSIIYYPYVAASGNYSLSIVVPGCQQMGDCARRTDVDIEVFPFLNSLGWTSTISQQVSEDTTQLVYEGYIERSSSGLFQPTVSLALAKQPSAPSSGSTWDVVAGNVQLVFTAVAANGTQVSSGNSSMLNSTSIQTTYGVFEWPLANLTAINATSVISSHSETAADRLGVALGPASSVLTAVQVDSVTFIGGNFSRSGSYSNVLSLSGTAQVATLAAQGLNDVVRTSMAAESTVFFGGDFTATADGSTQLTHVAEYAKGAWAPLAGGVDGPVSHISQISDTTFAFAGNFSHVTDSDGNRHATGGWALWDTSARCWDISGILFGNTTTASTSGSSDGARSYIAGRVLGSAASAANGFALLSGDGSKTTLSSLDSTIAPAASSFASLSARSLPHRIRAAWMSRFSKPLLKRATPESNSTSLSAFGVNAGAYYTNSTDKATWLALGGNFTSLSDSPLLFLDPTTSSQHGPNGGSISGVVQQLAVSGSELFVAGQFTRGSQETLAIYDLSANAWSSQSIPALNTSSGSLEVNAMSVIPNTQTLLVAGNFARAGGLSCVGICAWDIAGSRFNTLGNGLGTGVVQDLAFAGSSSDIILVVGAFSLSGSTSTSYAASYAVNTSAWTALDGLPGPATAVTADNLDANSIWAAGQQFDGSSFLAHYDGRSWSTQNASLGSNSLITQLAFVPLSTSRSGSSLIENDRLLMVSGQYTLNGQNYSAATYDGTTLNPYLAATSSDGSAGSAARLSFSQQNFSFHSRRFLAKGLVVLVAIAIATGLVFLFCLIGLLLLLLGRRRRGEPAASANEKAAARAPDDSASEHAQRLHQIQKALFGAAAADATAGGAAALAARPDSPTSSFGGEDVTAPHTATVRFDFVAEEEGELSVSPGEEVEVLEVDEQWTLVRSGPRTGFIPSSYLY